MIYHQRCPLDRFREWELLNEGGRAISVNRHHFIHAIVPRHVETVVQLSKGNISSQNVRVEFSLEAKDYPDYFVNEIYRTIAAAVDDEDLLLTAAIDMMDSDENGLYFLNAKGELYGGMSGQCSGKKVML